jgi:class 3 adenylate cyclase/DNA-binding CsgD family transcriptional regulator/tetratricopeptide (TPR) repeat protein
MELPTGTVTFLFTDVEESTRLAKALGTARFSHVLDQHRRLLRDAFRHARGVEVDSQGDGCFVAFRSASEAVRAAADAQRAHVAHRWPEGAPVRVRIGIHTGEAAVVDEGYRGLAVHRAARICTSAQGGQVLLSGTTRDLVEADLPPDIRLRDLGLVQLRDIDRPERLFQLVVDGLPEAFAPPRAPAPRAVPAYAADLLERDAELAALDALIAAAPTGGRLLAIEGPAGIGKTRLVAEARERARASGMRVLAARGSELEHEFSYGVVRQLFEPMLASASDEERTDVLAGAAELSSPIFDPSLLGAEPDADASLAMLHGLFWLTANLTGHRPALLAIDDLHWCDPSSLRWLAYLLPRLEGLALLIVVGLRPSEPGADLALLRGITTDPLATVVRPGVLSEDGTGALVRNVFAADIDPAFLAAFHEASGGNPLLVRELANAIAHERLDPTAANAPRLRDLGGQAVSRAVSLRLSHLSAEATGLAQAVAILGDGADPLHAAAVAGLDDVTAADVAADLERVEILRRDVAYAFVHPVVGAAVYAELGAAQKDRGHYRAAGLLATSGADPERIAAQLLLAAPRSDEWAVGALRDAARSAIGRGVPDSAVAYLRRALDEPPGQKTVEVLHELGSAEARVAAPEAIEHLSAARAGTRDIHVRARIALELARARFSMGDSPKNAVEVVQEAVRELPADDDSELALELQTQLIGIARHDPDLHPLAAERLERLRVSLPRLSFGREVVLANLASEATRAGMARADAIELAEQALAGGSLLNKHFDPAFVFAVGTLTAADRLDAAVRLYGEAMDHARTRGLVLQFWLAACFRSGVAVLRGDLADAVADAELCLDVIDSNGLDDVFRPGAVAFLAQALIERGETTRARQSLASASAAVDAMESRIPMHISFFYARARLFQAEGEYERALHEFVSRGRRAEDFGYRNPALFAWRSQAALASLALGRNDDARRHASEELELSRRWGAPGPLGRSLIAAGLADEGDVGIQLLREAVTVLERSPARLERARAHVELGAALRRANQRSDSREPLRRGLELATLCGAAPLAVRAETELLATGARPRRIALSGVESLTPSERRVAQMAAEGSTNREIAQALFVTPKTIEVHLSSVYRKLGINSRSQLSGELAEPGPVPRNAPG